MENNNNEPFNPAQPFSTQAMPPQQASSMSATPQGSSSKVTIVLFIILIIVIISGGVVLYIVNQPSQSTNEPTYLTPPTQPPVEPTIIPTITPTVDEELLNLEDPIDATADLQDIDTELQQL